MAVAAAALLQAQNARKSVLDSIGLNAERHTRNQSSFEKESHVLHTKIDAIKQAMEALDSGLVGWFRLTESAGILESLAEEMAAPKREALRWFLLGTNSNSRSGPITGILKEMGDTMIAKLEYIDSINAQNRDMCDELMLIRLTQLEALDAAVAQLHENAKEERKAEAREERLAEISERLADTREHTAEERMRKIERERSNNIERDNRTRKRSLERSEEARKEQKREEHERLRAALARLGDEARITRLGEFQEDHR